jgi:hypothetical protein
MSKCLIILGLLITIPCLTFAQSGHSPYAGQEKREIKALSHEDIEGYLAGEGMGFAKAGEQWALRKLENSIIIRAPSMSLSWKEN